MCFFTFRAFLSGLACPSVFVSSLPVAPGEFREWSLVAPVAHCLCGPTPVDCPCGLALIHCGPGPRLDRSQELQKDAIGKRVDCNGPGEEIRTGVGLDGPGCDWNGPGVG